MKKLLVSLLIGTMCLGTVGCGLQGEEVQASNDEKYLGEELENHVIYPQSVEGFIGDTMPFYCDGKFNVFYLADQRNGSQGYHPYGLITTTDFTSYDDKGVVIPYGESIEDQDIALGTGSVIKDKDGLYHCFYTGHNDTYSPKEAVMHATSSDLENWTKIPGDTFTANGNYSTDDFRDPYVLYVESEKQYWMLVTTRHDNMGVIAKYTSKDLSNWSDAGVYFENDMGTDANMECPTLLEYKGKWYLSFSDQWPYRQVHYRVADSIDGTFEIPKRDVFDCDGFYAGRMETDGDNLYVVGWNGTKKTHQDTEDYDWGGNMVTHMLRQESDGTLVPVVNTSIKNSMTNELDLTPQKMTETVDNKDGSYKFSGKEYEYVGFKNIRGSYLFETNIDGYDNQGMFGFAFNTNQENVGNLNIVFDCANNKIEFYNTANIFEYSPQSTLDYDFSKVDTLDVSAVISDGIVVVYVNDEVAFTTRMYLSQGYEWGLFSINSNVNFNNTRMYK